MITIKKNQKKMQTKAVPKKTIQRIKKKQKTITTIKKIIPHLSTKTIVLAQIITQIVIIKIISIQNQTNYPKKQNQQSNIHATKKMIFTKMEHVIVNTHMSVH